MAKRRVAKRRTPSRRRSTGLRARRSAPRRAVGGRTRRRIGRRAGPVGRYVRRRRNPVPRKNMIMKIIQPAATATTGALALDIAWAYLPLPVNFKTGTIKYVAKGVGALGLTWLASQVVNRRTAEEFGIGAMTVLFYQFTRELLTLNVPDLKLDGLGAYISPAYQVGNIQDMRRNRNSGMNAYVSGGQSMMSVGNEYDGMGAYVS